ncbi:MAG: tetratricopeptide repeat protein [Treponema sp.]|jgi:tetratricopeptide (TPR) repeat protein|nr:tetratricopeptide repeat protein [Treponema sp.]
MKKFREIAAAFLLIIAVSSLIYFMYRSGSTKTNRDLAKRISELSPRGGPPETIEGLRKAIALYEDQIERNVREGAQTGAYWKILAIRLADRGMHRDALDAFERAIFYNADDAAIYNLTAVSAATVAKSIVGFSANAESERERFYKLAENSYLRALQIDETYARPMYGIAVLYAFELERPAEAVKYLERYLKIQTNDIQALFVLARAYVMTGDYGMAIEQYDRIIARTKDQNIKNEAQNNKNIIQDMRYE